jgi:hypothetical protein
MTKAQKILEFIGDYPEKGVGLREIQSFIIAMNHGFARLEQNGIWFVRRHDDRGYYCTNLYGPSQYGRYLNVQKGKERIMQVGLLEKFCIRLPNGKWKLTEKIEAPFYRMDRDKPTKSFVYNNALRLGYYERARRIREMW